MIAIVGRPNVGKSTLFNRLTKTRRALVDDMPGVTRDRLYGQAEYDERVYTLVDTGGFDPPADQAFAPQVHAQVNAAISEADLILFLSDALAGLSPMDQEVDRILRRAAKPVVYAVNKVDGPEKEDAASEFYALNGDIHFISAAHGYGIRDLMADIETRLPAAHFPPEQESEGGPVRVALLGRPNAGKSSLLNQLLGSERAVVSDVPGTTRDALDSPLSQDGQDYLLIDTVGIRRQGKVKRGLEKAGVMRSIRACQRCHVAVCLVDAKEGLTDQDLKVIGMAVEAHRGLVIVFNKWDLVQKDPYAQKQLADQVDRLLDFAPWAVQVKISALTGRGVNKILPAVNQVHEQYTRRVDTGPLNQALEGITSHHQPPVVKGRRLKFYYATQVSTRPPTIVIFVSNPKGVHFSYQRYLLNQLREFLKLDKAPLRLILRERSGRKKRNRS
jgi:GTP-binding protein